MGASSSSSTKGFGSGLKDGLWGLLDKGCRRTGCGLKGSFLTGLKDCGCNRGLYCVGLTDSGFTMDGVEDGWNGAGLKAIGGFGCDVVENSK